MMIRRVLMMGVVATGLMACQEKAATTETTSESPAAMTVGAEAPMAAAPDAASLTEATWESKVHDFGEITQGVPVTHTFKVKNTGDQPLIITAVKASCGCTATEYTKEAIAPGEEGIVQAQYNAAAEGVFNKSVTVTYNVAAQREMLSLKGNVIKK